MVKGSLGMPSQKESDGMISDGLKRCVCYVNTMWIELHRSQYLPEDRQDQHDLFHHFCQDHPIINIKKNTFNVKLTMTILKCEFLAFFLFFRLLVLVFCYLRHDPSSCSSRYNKVHLCLQEHMTQDVDFQQEQ